MKKIIFIIAFLFTTAFTFAQVSVKGYYRSNGTYVQPHQRTGPNYTRNDNYSTVGNTNPYTGEAGTKSRDENTSSSSYTTSNSSYSSPSYSTTTATSSPNHSTTTTSTPSYSSSNTIYTGSRGGQYYINSNGNKTYVRRN